MSYTPENLRRWSHPQCYAGATWEGYYAAPVGRSRDSSDLEESNWAQQWETLKPVEAETDGLWKAGENPPENVLVIRENHWAVGWVEWVAIHESNEAALRAADAIAERLEDYPVLNDDDFSSREMESAQTVWRDCMSVSERIAYVREHRRQFEFRDFSDLLGCIRGRYFAGYASELLA